MHVEPVEGVGVVAGMRMVRMMIITVTFWPRLKNLFLAVWNMEMKRKLKHISKTVALYR